MTHKFAPLAGSLATLAALAALLGVGSTPALADTNAGEQCSDVLKYGIFDIAAYTQDTSYRQQLNDALCSADIGSSEEALSLGFGVGFPIHGIPVQGSGNFDKTKVASWKKANCQSSSNSTDYRQSLASLVKKASPVVVEAWTRCNVERMRAQSTGLRCSIQHPTSTTAVFSAEWRSYPSDPGPAISFLKAYGGTCTPSAKVGDHLKSAIVLDCTRSSIDEPFVVSLATDGGGQCQLDAPAYDDGRCKERVFQGTTTLDADTTVACDRVVFEDGALVRVKNGARLSILARDIISKGAAKIDASGEPGDDGAPGASNGKVWPSQGDTDYWAAVSDCRSNLAHPERGGRGGDGGRGGAGAEIVLSGPVSGTLSIDVQGGPGGKPGPGGSGMTLKNGRNNYCDGCTTGCGAGPAGRPGDRGSNGRITALKK
jgi:hypothetical protein